MEWKEDVWEDTWEMKLEKYVARGQITESFIPGYWNE